MESRKATPSPQFNLLVTGHFREWSGYSTWREKGTGDWLLIYTAAGQGRFGSPAGDCVSRVGDLVLLQPGTPHDYAVEPTCGRWELLWAHFHPRPHWVEWLDWPREAPGLLRLSLEDPSARRRIVARFLDVHRLAVGPERQRENLAMNALEEVLLLCEAQNPRAAQVRMDPRIRTALEHLCVHLSEKIGLDALAEIAGLSVSRFSHLFREQVGMTPQQFQEQQRLARARQLLELTPLSIGAIAEEVGFESPFYFTVRFKRKTGYSPREYRKRLE